MKINSSLTPFGALAVLVVATLMPFPAVAASFDCRKAATAVEELICKNPEISDLDEKLAEKYRQLLRTTSNKKQERRRQREWLRTVRDTCSNVACLKGVYTTRIAALSALEVSHDERATNTEKYKLAMSKNKRLCHHMLTIFNADLKKYGIEQYSSVEFTAIHWRSVHYSYDRGPNVSAPRLLTKSGEISEVDLDSDGVKETLLREPSSKYDIQLYEYMVLRNRRLLAAGVVTASRFERSTEWLGGLDGLNEYELRELPAQVGRAADVRESVIPDRVEPFIFDGVAYITFRQLPRFDLGTGVDVSGWRYNVIAKYKPGVLKAEHASEPAKLLDDVCYLERSVQ